MTLEALYDYAYQAGYDVDDVPMRKLVAVSFPQGWIALDSSKLETNAELKVKLAHEVGHVDTGSFYTVFSPYDTKARNEHRADKRAIELLVPRKELRRALRRGIVEPWELADYFGVTEEFMHMAIEVYSYTAA